MIRTCAMRRTAHLALLTFCLPLFLAGCGGGGNQNDQRQQTENRPGMTGKQKVAALVGAAALYYVYKTYRAQKENAPQNVRAAVPDGVQLYRSESTGAIYYRDPNNPKKVHWLTLPQNRIEVSQNDYEQIMRERSQWERMPVPQRGSPGPSDL